MNLKSTYIIILSAIALSATACHARKERHLKQQVSKDTPIPANVQQSRDTATRTPTPAYTPNTTIAPNTRPKPVPNPKPPVPPL